LAFDPQSRGPRRVISLVSVVMIYLNIEKQMLYDVFAESHHTAATNGGYSRRHDGGFYSI